MATIEYLTKRLEGKTKEIEKLEKKLQRIRKAEATGWEVNPYYYSEHDLRWTLSDLENAKKAHEDLTLKLQQAVEKSQSRNIKVIVDFLENWQKEVAEFYGKAFITFLKEQKAHYEADSKYCNWWNYERRNCTSEERKAIEAEHRAERSAFESRWRFLSRYVEREQNRETLQMETVLNTEKLQKELKADADAMYDDIIERTNKITGKITDASQLSIGEKGELNGYIFGERGTAKVQTIGAGGYNIQCFHFRTLIHRF